MKDLKAGIKSDLVKLNDQISMLTNSHTITDCNTVVMFKSGLTMGVDQETRKPVIENALFATQLTPEDAKAVCENTTNGFGEHPKCVTPLDYYKKQREHLSRMLSDLN